MPTPTAPSTFKPATLASTRLRCALFGPAGSGKTFTALRIAGGLLEATYGAGSRSEHERRAIAVIDTEHGSASKYADRFTFDTAEPGDANIETYTSLIREAGEAGYPVLIVDSL